MTATADKLGPHAQNSRMNILIAAENVLEMGPDQAPDSDGGLGSTTQGFAACRG
jgi:hypothetical protein